MAPLLPSSRCGRQVPPCPGILQAVEGHRPFPHLPMWRSPHISICFGVRNNQCLDSRPHGGMTVTAGGAKDFMESKESRRKKVQEVEGEEENRWEQGENLRKSRRGAQSMLEEDVASGEPARTQQSRKSMVLKQRHWLFSFPAAPAPQRKARMSETQAEIQPEALQSACSACKTLGSRAGARLRGDRKGWHMSPGSPCVTHTPHSAPAVCFPSEDTPGILCSSPAASACSSSRPSQSVNLPQKWSREEGGTRTEAPATL